MKESFEAAGAETRIIEFQSEAGRGFNVEATVRGTGDKHLWLTAHMDSVENAGANDNASGLTSLIETAEAIAEAEPAHTVHFVAYDLEEDGLIGSSRYVESTVKEIRDSQGADAIIGNINSDMIGYETDAFDAVIGTCDQAGPLNDAFRRAAREINSPVDLEEKCLGRSDHEQFWELGLSALVLTDGSVYDNYPHYHAASDTADKLNVRYLQSVIQLTTAATLQLVNQ
jgi:Zn-dependent M28 family amino/carboxypeptidase